MIKLILLSLPLYFFLSFFFLFSIRHLTFFKALTLATLQKYAVFWGHYKHLIGISCRAILS